MIIIKKEKNKENHTLCNLISPFFAMMLHISEKKCKDRTKLSSVSFIENLSQLRLTVKDERNLSMDKQ